MTFNGVDPEDLLAELLQSHIEALEQGKDAAAAHPPQAGRLNLQIESELDTAHNLIRLGKSYSPRPDFVMRSRLSLMQRIRQEARAERGRQAPAPFFFLTPRNRISRLAYQAVLLTLVLLVFLSSTFGAAYAAQAAVPGNQLYALKLGLESARLALTFAPEDKLELRLAFAEERLEEAGKLAQQEGYEHLDEAIQGYQGQIDQVAVLLEQLDGQELTGSMATVLNGLPAKIAAQTRVVQKLSEGAPASQQARVETLARHLEQKSQQIELFLAQHTQQITPELTQIQMQVQAAADGKKASHATGLDKAPGLDKTPKVPEMDETKPTKTEKPVREPKPTKTEKPTDVPKPTKTPKP